MDVKEGIRVSELFIPYEGENQSWFSSCRAGPTRGAHKGVGPGSGLHQARACQYYE